MTNSAGSAIGIDGDGNVWLSGFGRREKIGQDLRVRAPEAAEREFVPDSDIPTGRQQFTCASKGWRVVVLTSIRPIVRDEIQTVENRLVVALFRGSVGKLALQKAYPESIKVMLADVNGDGVPELAVQWMDGALISPATWLDIWRLDGTGNLVSVDLKSVTNEMDLPLASHADRVELGNYVAGDFSVYSEQRLVKDGRTTERVRKQYAWNGRKGIYEFKSKVVIEEKILGAGENATGSINPREGNH